MVHGNFQGGSKEHPILEAARILAAAKVEFAQDYLRHKALDSTTDKTAEMMAMVDSGTEVILAEAQLEIAKRAS